MGMRAYTSNKECYVLHTWFFSVCAYFVIAAKYNFIHEYYQVPIIPVGCLFAGKFITNFYRQNVSGNWYSSSKVWTVLLMIVFIPIHSIYKLNNRLRYNDTYLKIGAEIKEHTRTDDLIIANQRSASPQIFYYGQRKGWGVTLDHKLNPATLTEFVNKGARLYVMVGGNLEEKSAFLYRAPVGHPRGVVGPIRCSKWLPVTLEVFSRSLKKIRMKKIILSRRFFPNNIFFLIEERAVMTRREL